MKFLFFLLLSSCNILGSASPRPTNQDTALEDIPSKDLGIKEVGVEDLSSCDRF